MKKAIRVYGKRLAQSGGTVKGKDGRSIRVELPDRSDLQGYKNLVEKCEEIVGKGVETIRSEWTSDDRVHTDSIEYDYIQNKIIIFEKGQPVYENDNGMICEDTNVLWDCL